MTMLEKQLTAATREMEKVEKALERVEKKMEKVTKVADKFNCNWTFEEWCVRRDNKDYTPEQNDAYSELYYVRCDMEDVLRRYAQAEKNLNKLQAKQDNNKAENDRLKNYSIPALDTFLDKWEQDVINYYIKEGEYDSEKDKDIKYDKWFKKASLIYKLERRIGKIVDASGLYVGVDGNINGIVKGEKDTAICQSIYAGGYNIQCLHFRFLVK